MDGSSARRCMGREHVDSFHERGFAVVRQVFEAHEVAEMAAAFDRIQAEGLAHPGSYRHRNVFFRQARDPQLGRVLRLVQWPSYFDDTLDAVRLDSRMLDLIAPLIGSSLKQIINQLHWKPPGARAEFAYHQDIRFRRPRAAFRELPLSYVQTGIAIDPHRSINGCMRMLPGSHLKGELPLGDGGSILTQSASDQALRDAGLDPADLCDLELEPGDVALWHLLTVHGSGPNRSGMDRRFYLNGYVKAENSDRGAWAFREGVARPLGEPVLIHYEDLHRRPGPFYLEPD
jgi:ectoine hydroxylase-related dioxygenase (phytanoyl-CoA dioxygenase family)